MPVGFIYDDVFLQHDTRDHIEGRDRLPAILTALDKTRVMQHLTQLSPRAATMEELSAVHDRDYIHSLKHEIEGGGGWLDPDTYVSKGSWEAALNAAGGLMKAVDAVLKGSLSSAFALVRPPGHHAVATHQMGFCLFNNVAIAAKHALKNHDIKRVLIIDWDVHHGNGTQEAFYTDPQVLYFSTHQYPWYPYTGSADETGTKSGQGYNVNVPMEAGWGDTEYLSVFQDVLTPLAMRFKPDLVLVSAGYDPHWQDTISSIMLTTTGFARLAKVIRTFSQEVCEGRMVFTLEGGYNRSALAYSVAATFEIMLGTDEIYDPLGSPPVSYSPVDFAEYIQHIQSIHKLKT
jgi:acetoin utilization deacetylase AcuC-like enzyme